MKNLWQDLGTLTSDVKNPVDLIRTQSEFLDEGTNGLFYIDIDEFTKESSATSKAMAQIGLKGDFMYKMSLCSDYLSEYSFNIFNIYYGISFYPLLVNVPYEIGQEIERDGSVDKLPQFSSTREYFKANSEEQFEQILEAIFNCEKVRTILTNMKTIIGDSIQEE